MILQRVRAAEMRAKYRLSNGPLRALSNALILAQSIRRRETRVSCRGYVGISICSLYVFYSERQSVIVLDFDLNSGAKVHKTKAREFE